MAGEVTKAQLDSLEIGLQAALDRIDALLKAKAYAEQLPIIGTHLATASNTVSTITTLAAAVRGAIDSLSDLGTLASKTVAEVQTELTTRIRVGPQAYPSFQANIGVLIGGYGP